MCTLAPPNSPDSRKPNRSATVREGANEAPTTRPRVPGWTGPGHCWGTDASTAFSTTAALDTLSTLQSKAAASWLRSASASAAASAEEEGRLDR